jgi:hypothetical protein
MEEIIVNITENDLCIYVLANVVEECSHMGECESMCLEWVNEFESQLAVIPNSFLSRMIRQWGIDPENIVGMSRTDMLVYMLWIACGNIQESEVNDGWAYISAY